MYLKTLSCRMFLGTGKFYYFINKELRPDRGIEYQVSLQYTAEPARMWKLLEVLVCLPPPSFHSRTHN